MIDDEKRALRKIAMERREILARDAGPRHGDVLAKMFLDSVPLPEPASRPSGITVSGFWSMGAEINVIPLLSLLYERGYYCGLPVTVKRGLPLVFRHWAPGSVLVSGGFGTSVPPPDAPEVTPDVLIVPLLAFDRQGYRLGYGGGFYDRTLAKLRAAGSPLAVGMGLSGQEVPAVPREDFDQRLDWMVTEREAFRIEDQPLRDAPSGRSSA